MAGGTVQYGAEEKAAINHTNLEYGTVEEPPVLWIKDYEYH